jgi:hypothetical protein
MKDKSLRRAGFTLIRSSMSIYYGDMEGVYPADMYALTLNSKYMASIPLAKTPNYHADSSSEKLGNSGSGPDDTTGWLFGNVATDQFYGQFFVNCSHTDTKGSAWTAY